MKYFLTYTRMIFLNDRWRVRLNDPLQWILEYREGALGKKSTGYRGRAFCTQRRTLLRDIKERIIDEGGEVDPDALRQVEALPEKFPYRTEAAPEVELKRAA